MKISDLIVQEPFSSLFPISRTTLANVVMDMKLAGYDAAQPVVVWQGKNIILDGHTRVEAAKLLGLDEIPVVERAFTDEDAALRYAVHCQRDRRNLTDADIDRLVLELDKRHKRGGDRKSEKSKASLEAIDPAGKSADTTAELIGTSRSKVEKARAVQKMAAPEVKQAVADGKLSINKAYQQTRNTKQAQPGKKKPIMSKEEAALLKHCIGLKYAHLAIMDLERIRPDDEERNAAFDLVEAWLREARK